MKNKLDNAKVLVIGASGFIGRFFSKRNFKRTC
jgi:nucleoside-diphosphate-sugar epimerase